MSVGQFADAFCGKIRKKAQIFLGRKFVYTKKPFLVGSILTGLLLLFWLPYFLAYYPGICAYDSCVQVEQILTESYNQHHPLLHTLMIRGCLSVGKNVFGSSNVGIACYVGVQSILLAMAMTYGIMMVWKARGRFPMLLQLWFMFCPIHPFMALSVTKDTMFAMCMLVLTTSLLQILFDRISKKQRAAREILFMLSGIGCVCFRNNGKYAFLVLIFLLIVSVLFRSIKVGLWKILKGEEDALGKLQIRLFGEAIFVFIVSCMILSLMARELNAQQGDKREMLSVPIQQLSRTMIYHGGVGMMKDDDDTITQEQKNVINNFLLGESYLLYRQDISDPVKRNTNTFVVRYQTKSFLSVYLQLFLEYPGDYVNAFLTLNAGFLDPFDVSHAKVNLSDNEEGLGYIQTRWGSSILDMAEIYKASVIPSLHEKLEKYAGENGYLRWPVIRLFMKPGIYFWLFAFFLWTLFMKRSYDWFIPLGFLAGYYLTILFGPTVQLRYIYPVMLTLLILLFCYVGNDKEVEHNK